jgi:hypothetical protein
VLEDFLSCSFGTLVSRCIVYELLWASEKGWPSWV